MSTPNFARCYFRNVYAIDDDALDAVYYKDDIQESLLMYLPAFTASAKDDYYHNVGYGGATGLVYDTQHLGKWSITYTVVLLSGYYGGVNLDLVIDVYDETTGDRYSTADRDELDVLPTYAQKILTRKTGVIEKALAKVTTPLHVVGVFSNGEAVYRAV